MNPYQVCVYAGIPSRASQVFVLSIGYVLSEIIKVKKFFKALQVHLIANTHNFTLKLIRNLFLQKQSKMV